jgi:hypothetical protein
MHRRTVMEGLDGPVELLRSTVDADGEACHVHNSQHDSLG